MNKMIKTLSLFVAVGLLAIGANAQPCLDTVVYNGTGTYYTVGPGNCSFPVPASPIYTAAINTAQYDSSASCGGCIAVTGPLGMVVVSIEDQCPGCALNSIDFSKDAFAAIADTNLGIANIQWRYVACPVSGPVKIFFGPGGNPYYISMQVRNHRYPVQQVEFSHSGGAYTIMTRGTDNMFFLSPPVVPAVSPYSFRITDILGNVIEETNIPFSNSTEVTGVNQFPVCTPSTGIEALSTEAAMRVYPNHSDEGIFTVENNSAQAAALKVYDPAGKLILQESMQQRSNVRIAVEHKGMLLIQLTLADGTKLLRKAMAY